ncbi:MULTISPECIES: hypothetical protein [unclassified Nocardioides]|uniref:hypothetical protein n=1 Tax=unclassified Nocardioides TaxID=2615069 RepID=UPI002405728B|nr:MULTISPECIES: hypothetical protein [unclassified Nocardioides]MDF9714739.1 hypothetical protein [Nocardioides sp. ChNu-99]
MNALHVLLGVLDHDFTADEFVAANPAAQPLPEALVTHATIDFDAHVQRAGAPVTTLRDRVLAETKEGNPLRRAAEASAG